MGHCEIIFDDPVLGKGPTFICSTGIDICECGNEATAFCDFRPQSKATCDEALCDKCKVHVCGDMDHCRKHSIEFETICRELARLNAT